MGTIGQRDLQGASRQVDAGTGNALRLEPHEDVGAKAVVHVIPESQGQKTCNAHHSGSPVCITYMVTSPQSGYCQGLGLARPANL